VTAVLPVVVSAPAVTNVPTSVESTNAMVRVMLKNLSFMFLPPNNLLKIGVMHN